MEGIRIVIADDHPIFRDGLRRLLEAEREFLVAGEAHSGNEALRVVAAVAPDVLLLDLAMEDGTGLEVLEALNASRSTVKTLLLTAAAENHEVMEAIQLGARGLVLKHAATTLLYRAIRGVMAGEYWLGHDRIPSLIETLRQLGQPDPPSPVDTLTSREIAVIGAVVDGATNRDVSEQLNLSEQTVKNHLSHIYDKVGVSNRLELVVFAMHHNLLAKRKKRP